MAVLTAADYKALRESLYQGGLGKEELKALPVLPSKQQLMACFQSIEDTITNAFPNIKSQMETDLGTAIPGALAQKILVAYLRWRIKQ